MKDFQDAYGHQLYDYYEGRSDGLEIVERDDGFIQANFGPKTYLSEYKDWSKHEKAGIRYAKGRILDIGCGAGRHALYLQNRGHRVLGVDVSPLALKVARTRGLKETRTLSISELTPKLGMFDTILMLGNNFGLFANPRQARSLLRRFLKITNPHAVIIAESLDVYQTKDPDHLRYHQFNKKRGRMAGQVHIRVRYKNYSSPWFDYLLVSQKEMREIVEGTSWKIVRFISNRSPRKPRSAAVYIAIFQRQF